MKFRKEMPERSRLLCFEALEDRRLLSVSPADLTDLREEWTNFIFDDHVNPIEIAAKDLSLSSIQAALKTAAETETDDLILIHTASDSSSLVFSSAADSLVINIDAVAFGRVTILVEGDAPLTLDANSLDRVLTIDAASEVQLGNLILTGGRATTDLDGLTALCGRGGGIANSGKLRLDRVTVTGNSADNGLFSKDYFGCNSTGGGIYNAGSLQIFRSEITENIACSCDEGNKDEIVAYGAGGGIFNEVQGELEVYQTIISRNSAESGKKVISEGSVSVPVEFMGIGGGICNNGNARFYDNTIIANNSAWYGGGLYNSQLCAMSLTDTSVTDNEVLESGGGIYGAPGSSLDILRSVIQGNSAVALGGGIAQRGALSIIGSVISGNSAGSHGGGICSYGTYSDTVPVFNVDIVNSTITGNIAGTEEAASGGGISFTGTKLKNTFAVMTVRNSIVVNNKVSCSENGENDLNIAAAGSCSGYYSLSSFRNWTNTAVNYLYDSDIPLFTKNYNFKTKTEGDYHLVWDAESQAVDLGNNAVARSVGINADSSDLTGQTRIQNAVIDLGAYEFQPSSFDSAFPSRLSVQQGGAFHLQCDGVDSEGNTLTRYLIDLDGDGLFDQAGSDLWISWNDLSDRDEECGYFSLAIENDLGQISQTKLISVDIIEVLPVITAKTWLFLDGQLLKLNLSIFSYNQTVRQGRIDWGDGSDDLMDTEASSLTQIHYYGPQTECKSFTLSLILKNDEGGEVVWTLGNHIIEVSNPEASESVWPDSFSMTEIIASESGENSLTREKAKTDWRNSLSLLSVLSEEELKAVILSR